MTNIFTGYLIRPDEAWLKRDLTKYFCEIGGVAGCVNDYSPGVISVLYGIAFTPTCMQTKNAEATSQHSIASIINAASAPTLQAHSLAPLSIGQFGQVATEFSPTGVQQPTVEHLPIFPSGLPSATRFSYGSAGANPMPQAQLPALSPAFVPFC